MRPQTIVIALPLEQELLQPLYEWGRRFDFEHVKNVHFIHVVKKNITPLEFGLVESPDDITYAEMVPTLHKFVKEESEKIIPAGYTGGIEFHIAKDFHPEEEFIDLLKTLQADLVVVSTRGKHGFEGFFHNSFTDYMVKYSPCDVFVVRPESSIPENFTQAP